jgi:hypothetical protein
VKTHRMSHLREYRIYKGMKGRCFNPNLKEYPDYGGRGITICPQWLGHHGFENFLLHVGRCPDLKMSIERKDVNKGYEPGNVRWATSAEQHKNRRKFVAINNYTDSELQEEYTRRFGGEYGITGC